MCRLDQSNESPPSTATGSLQHKAAASRRIVIITTALALGIFVLESLALIGCFLFRADSHVTPAILLSIAIALPATLILAVASWVFSVRQTTRSHILYSLDPAGLRPRIFFKP